MGDRDIARRSHAHFALRTPPFAAQFSGASWVAVLRRDAAMVIDAPANRAQLTKVELAGLTGRQVRAPARRSRRE
jgi:hypothetical protein